VRDETYRRRSPASSMRSTRIPSQGLGRRDTSSSDASSSRAGGHGEARATTTPNTVRARREFYTHVSDRYAPFNTKSSPPTPEAAHVLAACAPRSSLDIREHYTDTAGAIDHVFGLCCLLGFRFAPRIRDLADRRLYVLDTAAKYNALTPIIGGAVDMRIVGDAWVKSCARARRSGRNVAPSPSMRRSPAYPRQNAIAKALREIGRLEPPVHARLDQRSALAAAPAPAQQGRGAPRSQASRVSFHRLGEIPTGLSRTSYRASGLNLAVAAIFSGTPCIWDAPSMSCVPAAKPSQRARRPHRALGWEHIAFNGDYVWPDEPLATGFRPLRNPRAPYSTLLS